MQMPLLISNVLDLKSRKIVVSPAGLLCTGTDQTTSRRLWYEYIDLPILVFNSFIARNNGFTEKCIALKVAFYLNCNDLVSESHNFEHPDEKKQCLSKYQVK